VNDLKSVTVTVTQMLAYVVTVEVRYPYSNSMIEDAAIRELRTNPDAYVPNGVEYEVTDEMGDRL
jgi:hypothetical protein